MRFRSTPAHRIGAFSFIAFLAVPSLLGAQHAADLLFPDDAAYEAAFLGAIRSGRVPDTNVFPLFGNEVPKTAAESTSNGHSGLSASFSTPTLYYDSPAEAGELASNLMSDPSLTPRAFPEIQHFLALVPDPINVDFRLYPSDHLSFRSDLMVNYRRDRITGQSSTFQWGLNEWMGNLLAAVEFPRNAYLAWSGEGFGAAFGRFPSGMGWGRLSGSILNPRASWYDQGRFYLQKGSLRFTGMLATSSAQLSAAEREIQFRRLPDGKSFWDSLNDHDFAAANTALKLASWHQVEWKPTDWLSLGFAEMGMVGGRVPSLAFLLPSVIWHNTYAAGYANVAASFSLAAVPLPGLLISGEFLIDDTRSTDEPTSSKPNSFAWLGTVLWSPAPIDGLGFDIGAEYQHVDRWTYVRWQPYLSMYQRQTLTGGYYGLDQSLGAPWGPDSDSIGVYAQVRLKSGAALELRYEFVRKGPIYQGMASKLWVTADFDNDPSTNDPPQYIWVPVYYDYDKYAGDGELAKILARPDEFRHLVSLTASFPLRPGLEAKLASTFGLYRNFGNVSGMTNLALLVYAGIVVHLPVVGR